MKKIIIALLTVALLITTLTTTLFVTTDAATTGWVGGSSYGWYANHTAALNEVKALMQQQTTSYKMSRFNLILTEFPLSGYFNSKKTSGCNWHCGTCLKRDSTGCINSFYDSETGKTVSLNAWQCYGYARYCSYRFFGSTLQGQGVSVSSGYLSSASNFKSFINSYSDLTGAHFRVNGSHSLVYLAKDNTYVYFIDANSGYNSATGLASNKCSANSSHHSTCCKINLRRFTYSEFVNRYTSVTLYHVDAPINGTVSISIGSATIGNTISDNDARIYGNVTKPASYAATKFGISIRKSSSASWEKTFPYAAQSSHVGESSFDIWFDMVDEVGYPLTHQTSYTYQFFAVINGKDYYSPEATFTTTGSHSYGAWQTVTPASCTTRGSQKRTCACGDTQTQHIPAIGHSYGEWEYVQTATCTANGTKKRTCGSCGHIEYGTLLSGGHNYSSTFTVDKPATCTTQGSKSKHCAWCTSKIEVTAIPATGHSYGAWQTVTKPSCTATGSQKHVCSSCSHTEYKTVAALGHDYSSAWTTDKAATCTTAGTKSHHCSRCTARSSVTTIPANGHSWSGWTVTKKATYEETGLKVRECTVNGCSAEESSVIAKLPLDGHTHNFGEWVTETAATCVVNGVQKRTCSICKSFETREITAIGHSFGEWVVEKTATCEAGGIQKRTCSSCKETETLSSPALGHKFGEWAVKTEATADKEGVLERKCNNCSETETQTTPKLNISVDTSSNTPSEDTSSKLESDPKPETDPEPEADKTNGSPKGNSLTTVIIICSAIIGILLAALIVLVIIKKKK